jgi:hypothetical protein
MTEFMAEADWDDLEVVDDVEVVKGTSRWALWRSCLAVCAVLAGVGTLAWYGSAKANLNTEYFNIARALAAGEGFAHPFQGQTGPTAWMAPALPVFLAALLYAGAGDANVVAVTTVALQIFAVAGTGILVLALVRHTTRRVGPLLSAAMFLVVALAHFRICFLTASLDCWLLLLAVDLLLAGLCWASPLSDKKRAVAWGIFGAGLALVSPVVGFTWGMMSLPLAWRQRNGSRLALAFVAAMLTLMPWMIRNYLLFGRLIPVKSNLAYELYQSQCRQRTGLLRPETFGTHPYQAARPDGREYRALGEAAFLDLKRQQFLEAVQDNPGDFLDRLADRFLGALLWHEPFNAQEARYSWVLRLTRVIHPLPFLASLLLIFWGVARDLPWACWAGVGVYLLCLLPYVAISYYDRYSMPLVGVKALLVLWAIEEVLCALRGTPAEALS